MATYYVGAGGNNANAGTSWALRKETLDGAEDIPVAAGDTVYVGPGTYAAMTVDVSGSSGSPITYIGDYTGANTDGTGGVVGIAVNNVSSKNYRTYSGFAMSPIKVDASTNWTIEECAFVTAGGGANAVEFSGAGQAGHTVRRCYLFTGGNTGHGVRISHTGTVDDVGHVVENCIFVAGGVNSLGVSVGYVGGVAIRNCLFWGVRGVSVNTLSAGQTVTVHNSVFIGLNFAINSDAAGQITEDYNTIVGCKTARTNTTAGANSVTHSPNHDPRWFFEMVNGGSMVSPFDIGAGSSLIELNSGTGAPTADMRGTTVQGTYREWGPLEYDSTLDIKAGSGGGGGPVVGSRVIRGLGAI